jgi:arginyl-tRNA synthetase
MITADLDRELAAAIGALTDSGALPPAAAHSALSGTWRSGPDGNPASYTTPAPFEIAGPAGLTPAQVASAIAGPVSAVPWIVAARPSGSGYLSITVTDQALALSAARMAAAGLDCANSAILRGPLATSTVAASTVAASTGTISGPWPDLAAASSWQQAWQQQADAMTSHLAQAAGAAPAVLSDRERASTPAQPPRRTRSPVADAVGYLGPESVRYWLARMMPGSRAWPATAASLSRPGSHPADPLYPVQQAHAAAASTLRWAADLGLEAGGPSDQLGQQLSCPSERDLLSLLSFLPVRVAAAARRNRPDELPRYLEQVSALWLACQLQAPALPFGGRAAPADPAVSGARLVLASAVAAVLAAGLALTGIAARARL